MYKRQEGSYILNADDLCTAPFIDLILQAGVDSLKIEGRAKTFYYVASTTSAYRRAVNAYLDAPDAYMCPEDVLEELTRTCLLYTSYRQNYVRQRCQLWL